GAGVRACRAVSSRSVALTWSLVPTARFSEYLKYECHFSNGMERVRYLERHIYNHKDFLRFDSAVGEFSAVTQLGRPEAESWNSRKEILEDRRAAVDTFCRYNFGAVESFTVQRRGECGAWAAGRG
ncbi:HLA class II histocompatibility antigen, DR beta 5 chain-like, partial [Fukomys damarensis]|uniref:HLA class II histocompatibility antigen, DR beta 5 chain-like n=1 Tax=Fukomys damarensis TaxID=885580 RepID=UPI0014554E52